MRSLTINGRVIDDDHPAYVIAEIGHNHQGDLGLAKKMVSAAQLAGASAVKFQTRTPKEVYTPAEYNRRSNSPNWFRPTYGEHREYLEFSIDEWDDLFVFCRQQGITAFSTPFDFQSVERLEALGVPAYKIASGDATNIPLLIYVAKMGKPMLVSTGGCTLEEVRNIYRAVMPLNQQLALLQCACVYPAPDSAMNLRVIETYQEEFPECVIGLSSHNPDWTVNIAAYALGARIFENHFTTDRGLKGTDQAFSLTPEMVEQQVRALQRVQDAMGTKAKFPSQIELAPTLERRKKCVWARDLRKGHIVVPQDIAYKCPGDGLSPGEAYRVIGGHLQEDVRADDNVKTAQVVQFEEVYA